jgi:hypothetical protein
MKHFLLFSLSTLLLLGCNIRPENNIEELSYFNIEELLDAEIQYLIDENAGLEKTVESNGNTDLLEIHPQTKDEWESQFSLFYEANIDQPGLRDAYREEELTPLEGVRTKIFSARAKKSFVQTFEVIYNQDKLSQINIQTQEENEIYSNYRTLKLFFDAEGKHIVGFDVTGDEDMRLKEPMKIHIQAVITY